MHVVSGALDLSNSRTSEADEKQTPENQAMKLESDTEQLETAFVKAVTKKRKRAFKI